MNTFQHIESVRWLRSAVGLACLMAAASAQALTAVTPQLSATGAQAAAGAQANVSFDIDFGNSTTVGALAGGLLFNAGDLSLNSYSFSLAGQPVDLLALLGSQGLSRPLLHTDQGLAGLLWIGVNPRVGQFQPLTLSGHATLDLRFTLDSDVAPGAVLPVVLGLATSSGMGQLPAMRYAVANITAVPEPETWALMLAGGVGLLSWMRRQNARPR